MRHALQTASSQKEQEAVVKAQKAVELPRHVTQAIATTMEPPVALNQIARALATLASVEPPAQCSQSPWHRQRHVTQVIAATMAPPAAIRGAAAVLATPARPDTIARYRPVTEAIAATMAPLQAPDRIASVLATMVGSGILASERKLALPQLMVGTRHMALRTRPPKYLVKFMAV